MKAVLLINPGARRNRGGGAESLRQAARRENITTIDIPQPDRPVSFLPFLNEHQPDLLFVSGGDGTCQAVVTALAEQTAAARQEPSPHPKLVLLPHGTTNMTAQDISVRAQEPEQVTRIMALARSGRLDAHVIRRRTVKVAGLENPSVQHGFFVGGGAVARAARQNQKDLNARGIKGDIAAGITLMRALFSRSTSGWLSEEPMVLSAARRPPVNGPVLTVMISTLEKLVLGCRPFWGPGDGPLRITYLRRPLTGLLMAVPKVMYGGPERKLPPAYVSFAAASLTLELGSDILIDGEFYAPAGEGPLHISAGPEFEFIRP